jgi:hypothetical protein
MTTEYLSPVVNRDIKIPLEGFISKYPDVSKVLLTDIELVREELSTTYRDDFPVITSLPKLTIVKDILNLSIITNNIDMNSPFHKLKMTIECERDRLWQLLHS